MQTLGESELILTPEGEVYHLRLKPEHIADTILLVGDPGRVAEISQNFEQIECSISNREFVTHTGIYKGKRITALSTGIGTDNIDIVVQELDALVNIDLQNRIIKNEKKSLNLIRIGTSGAIQREVEVDTPIVSEFAIGFDGLLNFYAERNMVCDLDFEEEFKHFTFWNDRLATPYIVKASEKLSHLFANDIKKGITISAPGFYGPQNRVLRLALSDPLLGQKIEKFNYKNSKITNYEMECSALYGLAKLLGHEALTVCIIIANRKTKSFSKDYKEPMQKLIVSILDQAVLI